MSQTLVIKGSWDAHHPQTAPVALVQLELLCTQLRVIAVGKRFGDPPPDAPVGSLVGLWNHEVIECFLAGPNDCYLEIEMGPHGHHLIYQLQGIRNPVNTLQPQHYRVGRSEAWWWAELTLSREHLPANPWTVNAYHIHGVEHRRYRAAFPVPGAQPDFHRLHCFQPIADDALQPADPSSLYGMVTGVFPELSALLRPGAQGLDALFSPINAAP